MQRPEVRAVEYGPAPTILIVFGATGDLMSRKIVPSLFHLRGKGVLPEDGHPQVNPCNRDLWINDTYPNPDCEMTLMLYHQPSNRRVDLLRLKTQPSLKETCWRCDLHPRWHPDGTKVCVDSAHLGRRQLCVMDVTSKIETLR